MTANNAWIAKKTEYRLILIATGICIAFVISALLWPEPSKETAFSKPDTDQITMFKLPPRPAQTPAPEKKKMLKEAEPQTKIIEAPNVEPAKTPKPKAAPVGKPVPPVAKTPRHGFYVQVGSFRDPARARAQATKLRKDDWKADIVTRGNGMHAVWVGPWQSRAAANRNKTRLLNELKLKGFIINR